MNRIEFLHAIDYGDKQIVDMIVNHLDQCMVLYDLINNYNTIKRLEDTQNNVSFQIDMKDSESIENFVNKVNNSPNVSRFCGHIVNMQIRIVSDKSIIISMTKYMSRTE